MPVPPVVTTSGARAACLRISAAIRVYFVRNDDILHRLIESGLPQTEYNTGARLIDPKPLKT